MIVDANVLVSAILGNSLALIQSVQQRGHDLLTPTEQYREAELNGLRLAREAGRDGPRLVRPVLSLVQVVDTEVYIGLEAIARMRLDKAEGAQKDWSLLALAMITGDEVWTNDPDLFGTGIVTWKTINIRFAQAPQFDADSM